MFTKKKREERERTRLERRVRSLPTHDLLMWVDTTLSGIGQAISRYPDDPVIAVAEAKTFADALLGIITEMEKRLEEYPR